MLFIRTQNCYIYKKQTTFQTVQRIKTQSHKSNLLTPIKRVNKVRFILDHMNDKVENELGKSTSTYS